MDALMHTETREELFKASINLHNKLRGIPPHASDAKAYLKGAAGLAINSNP